MKPNLGNADRWVRLLVGAALVSLVFVGPRTAWGWIGLVPIATALFSRCPLYLPFGWSTLGSLRRRGKSIFTNYLY